MGPSPIQAFAAKLTFIKIHGRQTKANTSNRGPSTISLLGKTGEKTEERWVLYLGRSEGVYNVESASTCYADKSPSAHEVVE